MQELENLTMHLLPAHIDDLLAAVLLSGLTGSLVWLRLKLASAWSRLTARRRFYNGR